MGKVVGHRHSKRHGIDNRVDILVHPVVRFKARNGEFIEFESGLNRNIPPKVREKVEVFYDPSRPKEARIAVGSAIRLKPWHFVIAAAMLVVPAVLFFAFSF